MSEKKAFFSIKQTAQQQNGNNEKELQNKSTENKTFSWKRNCIAISTSQTIIMGEIERDRKRRKNTEKKTQKSYANWKERETLWCVVARKHTRKRSYKTNLIKNKSTMCDSDEVHESSFFLYSCLFQLCFFLVFDVRFVSICIQNALLYNIPFSCWLSIS